MDEAGGDVLVPHGLRNRGRGRPRPLFLRAAWGFAPLLNGVWQIMFLIGGDPL